jgi:hypothetical protein
MSLWIGGHKHSYMKLKFCKCCNMKLSNTVLLQIWFVVNAAWGGGGVYITCCIVTSWCSNNNEQRRCPLLSEDYTSNGKAAVLVSLQFKLIQDKSCIICIIGICCKICGRYRWVISDKWTNFFFVDLWCHNLNKASGKYYNWHIKNLYRHTKKHIAYLEKVLIRSTYTIFNNFQSVFNE